MKNTLELHVPYIIIKRNLYFVNCTGTISTPRINDKVAPDL